MTIDVYVQSVLSMDMTVTCTECTVHGCDCNMYMDNSKECLSVHALTERGVGAIGISRMSVCPYNANMDMKYSKCLGVHDSIMTKEV